MKSPHLTRIVAALAVAHALSTAGLALAQEKQHAAPAAKAAPDKTPTLKVGDAAPALAVEKWIKGEPVSGFEAGKVYVVEFWATWCGPCINAMPHLTALQEEYKDRGVRIIGVTTTDDRGNTLAAVERMVAGKAGAMGYTVAFDKGRQTYAAYMDAARQGGIPCSYVVDKAGKVAYIGHPMWLDMVLDGVVAGTWEADKGQAKIKAVQAEQRAIFIAADEDPAKAVTLFEEFEAKHPKVAAGMGDVRFHLLTSAGDTAAAAPYGAKIVDKLVANKNADGLNEFAWTIVDPEGHVEHKDLDLAFRAATEAVKITESKDGMILDTLARVHWLKGDRDTAIDLQKKAVDLAPANPPAIKEQLEATLKEYRNAKT